MAVAVAAAAVVASVVAAAFAVAAEQVNRTSPPVAPRIQEMYSTVWPGTAQAGTWTRIAGESTSPVSVAYRAGRQTSVGS